MKNLLLFCFLLISVSLSAQTGEITGKVVDAETGEGLPFANVYIMINDLPRGSQTDFDSFYSIKDIPK